MKHPSLFIEGICFRVVITSILHYQIVWLKGCAMSCCSYFTSHDYIVSVQVLKFLLHRLWWTPLPFSQCYNIHKFFMTSIHLLSSCILHWGNHIFLIQILPTICCHTKMHSSPAAIGMSVIFHQLVHNRKKWHYKVICKRVDKVLNFCFSAVLVSDTLIVFLLIYFVIDYCYLHRTCCTIICVLRCWPSVRKTAVPQQYSTTAPSISRWGRSHNDNIFITSTI